MPYKVRGLKQWKHATDPAGMSKEMRIQLKRAALLNGKLGERSLRQAIKAGGFEANAPLTVAIKGSGKKPLVDGGTLFQSVTSEVIDEFTVFVGILRSSGEAFNVGVTLAQGTAVRITPAMRGLFKTLWLASIGAPVSLSGRAEELFARKPGGWYPLSESKTTIVIPARDWVAAGFRNPAITRLVKANWSRALKKVMKKRAKGKK